MTPDRPIRARYFTVAEANAALPRLRELIEYASNCYQQVKSLAAVARQPDPSADVEGLLSQVEDLRSEIARIVEHVHAEGVEVKAVETPLLAFPAIYRGREVFLSWQQGERRVGWWHPASSGLERRTPVDYDALGDWEWLN